MDTNATNRTFLRIWTLVTARMQGQSSNDSELEDLLSQGDVFNDTIKSERANHRSSVEEALMYIALIIMIIIIITGATGNLLVIAAVHRTKKLQTTANQFIVNLAVCDLLLVTLILPFNIYTYLVDGWFLDMRLCKAVGFLGYSLAGTTLINVCVIAWTRYQLIVDPGGYTELFQRRLTRVLLAVSWGLPPLCLLPSLLGLWGQFGYVPMLVTCNLYLNHRTQSFRLLLLSVRAVVPSAFVAYCYAIILRLSRQSHRRVQRNTHVLHRQHALAQRHERHLTHTLGLISLIFLLSYVPCLITGIVDWSHVLSKAHHMFCEITVFVASAANPIIYGVMNTQFRDAFFSLCCCCCHQKQRQQLTHQKYRPKWQQQQLPFKTSSSAALLKNEEEQPKELIL